MTAPLKRSPVIFGCSGVALTPDEDRFFRDVQPHAFILFARNIGTADEVRALCAALRAAVADDDALIFIDQEGGRVARLKPPLAAARGPMARFEAWGDLGAAADAVFAHHRLMAAELMALGINADCSPVCDIRVPGAHDIIGDRAFSEDPNVVARLARAAADGLLAGGVMPVIKHIPGHGRAGADTHEQGAVIDTDLVTLAATDFVPFKALRDIPYAMTAHVTLTAVDPDRCVTLSKHAIDTVIRGTIGYHGLLMSDDLSMRALGGDMTTRGRDALSAGCDLLLHCNGDMAEMVAVAAAL
jgi:beta-N-acetylhexosaminidase